MHERRWKSLFIAPDACVPEHKTEEVREGSSFGNRRYLDRCGRNDFRQSPLKEPHTAIGLHDPSTYLKLRTHSADGATIPKTSVSGQRYSIEADVFATRHKL